MTHTSQGEKESHFKREPNKHNLEMIIGIYIDSMEMQLLQMT